MRGGPKFLRIDLQDVAYLNFLVISLTGLELGRFLPFKAIFKLLKFVVFDES